MSSTEVLLRAGSTAPLATSTATNSPSAALSSEPTDERGFATFRIGETTSSLRCTQLQRGWREPLSLVVRTAADVASAGFTSHLDELRDGTAAVVALAGQLQQSGATAAAQTLSVATMGVAENPEAEGEVTADRAQAGPVAHSSVPNLVLPAPSPATAAAYPVVDPPDQGPAAKEPFRTAHRPGFRQAGRPEGSGKVLLQARLHVASATADLTEGAASAAPLLKATMAAVGLSGASPGLPAAPRGGSAAATPQGPENIAEHAEASRQPAKTPMSASVWLQQTNGGVHGGNVLTSVPWQLSVTSITTEVAAAQGGPTDGAACSGRDSDLNSGLASASLPALVGRQPSTLRQLLRLGLLRADVAPMAQQQPSGDSLPAAQLQGDAHQSPVSSACVTNAGIASPSVARSGPVLHAMTQSTPETSEFVPSTP